MTLLLRWVACKTADDKIIVMSDNVFALKTYARQLQCPFICGETSNRERLHFFYEFTNNPALRTLFVSKVRVALR